MTYLSFFLSFFLSLFLSFSNDSVIVVLNVSYQEVNSLQILVLQEYLTDGHLGEIPAELLDIVTDRGTPYIYKPNHLVYRKIALKRLCT